MQQRRVGNVHQPGGNSRAGDFWVIKIQREGREDPQTVRVYTELTDDGWGEEALK